LLKETWGAHPGYKLLRLKEDTVINSRKCGVLAHLPSGGVLSTTSMLDGKFKALELFIASCKEEKSPKYDITKDVEVIREYAEVHGGPDTWKLLMRNKDNAYGRNAVKLAIYARHRVKCGEIDVKTEAYKKLEAMLFKKLLPMM
jgi:hypothetical protein